MRRVLAWLDARTGYRAMLRHLLNEPLPKGTGWFFTSGAALSLLLGIQLATGVVLTMYYIPSPALAYDSVRYITDTLTLGWMVRGLHVWGASFVVIAATVHLLRVFIYGAYKAPREVTWLSGVVLFLIVLALSLSGYLLPWDQKAYWATTVTINIAGSTPIYGEYLAGVLRGGTELGALTLSRWYAAHVLLLPALLVLFVVAHLALMRKHGISGPLRPQPGAALPFFPWHVIKDTVVMAAVFAALVAVVITLPAHLEEVADPADTGYVPRPEWYFLSLFQLLKYFPGPLEPIGTLVIPGLIVGFLLLLPFLDRRPDRQPFGRARRVTTLAMGGVVLALAVLTVLGLRDAPVRADSDDWGPRAIAGRALLKGPDARCDTCHMSGGPAAPLTVTRISKDEEWLLAHMADPVAIAPGVRGDDDPAPAPQVTRAQAQSIAAYLRRRRAGSQPPGLSREQELAATTFATMCIGCHRIAGEGGETGPDLSTVGARRDRDDLRRVITNARSEYPGTMMPAYGARLSEAQLDALVDYLASRR